MVLLAGFSEEYRTVLRMALVFDYSFLFISVVKRRLLIRRHYY